MVEKVSKRVIQSVHAAVDELAAAAPETFTALSTILSNLMSSAAAVAVPPRKGKAAPTKGKGKTVDPDDLEDDEDEEDNDLDTSEDDEDGELDTGEDEDEEDDELDDAPKGRGKGKASKPAKPTRGKSKQAVEEDEEEEEEEEESSSDAETLDLDDLEAETITEAFNNFQPTETHDKAAGGIRELTALLDGFGFDTTTILKSKKPLTPAQKKERLAAFASRVFSVIDAINEFDLDSIVEAIGEYIEDYKPKGRAQAAKEYQAATDLFKAAVIGVEDEE